MLCTAQPRTQRTRAESVLFMQYVYCVSTFFVMVFVRLGSHTAFGGILRSAVLKVIIDIRGTSCANLSRAANSRTCLPFGYKFDLIYWFVQIFSYISELAIYRRRRYAPRVPLSFRWSAFFILWWPVHFDPTRANTDFAFCFVFHTFILVPFRANWVRNIAPPSPAETS